MLPLRIIQDNGKLVLNSQPSHVLPVQATATNALSCTEKLTMNPTCPIPPKCTSLSISSLLKWENKAHPEDSASGC